MVESDSMDDLSSHDFCHQLCTIGAFTAVFGSKVGPQGHPKNWNQLVGHSLMSMMLCSRPSDQFNKHMERRISEGFNITLVPNDSVDPQIAVKSRRRL